METADGAQYDWTTVSAELPYYMSLSCNPEVVMSSLCGLFWESEVPRNEVSLWLHPILLEVPRRSDFMIRPGYYYEVLAFVFSICSPRLSALWFGAAITGLVPKVLRFVQSGTPPLDQIAYPWTGCAQSFMDITTEGHYFNSAPVPRQLRGRTSGRSATRRQLSMTISSTKVDHLRHGSLRDGQKSGTANCAFRFTISAANMSSPINIGSGDLKMGQTERIMVTSNKMPGRLPMPSVLASIYSMMPVSYLYRCRQLKKRRKTHHAASYSGLRSMAKEFRVRRSIPIHGLRVCYKDDDDGSLSDWSSGGTTNCSTISQQGESAKSDTSNPRPAIHNWLIQQ
ncbi:MAG: hypothetical protein MMC23_005301 [Stictis urceolatum]|nr:hypothetical protein [Stictis urceolata]